MSKPIRSICITWHIEDVQDVRPDLTDEQALAVLLNLKRNHDANLGINWDVIHCTAAMLYPEPC